LITLTRAQVREVDRLATERFGMSGLVLMENAGRGVADVLCSLNPRGQIVICCGKGNNGGDGFVIARHLDLRGLPVRVLLFANPAELTGDAAANYRILDKCGAAIETFTVPIEIERLSQRLGEADWIVDALLGTGATGEPRSPYAEAVAAINGSGRPVVAVDLPSGLDCDTGVAAHNTIRAAHTCTFVAAKPGFFVPNAKPYIGQLHVLDIGAPRQILDLVRHG
jgi:NAD(P)H-hydrate epimerase